MRSSWVKQIKMKNNQQISILVNLFPMLLFLSITFTTDSIINHYFFDPEMKGCISSFFRHIYIPTHCKTD